MKPTFTYLTAISLLTLTALSCRKEGHEQRQQVVAAPQTFVTTVPAGQVYSLNVGVGSSLSISKQASHYELSEVAAALDGNTVYKYVSAKGYTGTDEVTLQQATTSTSPGGGCGSHDGLHTVTTVKTIVIKFNVAN